MTFILRDDYGYVIIDHQGEPILAVCSGTQAEQGLYLFYISSSQRERYEIIGRDRLKVIGTDIV